MAEAAEGTAGKEGLPDRGSQEGVGTSGRTALQAGALEGTPYETVLLALLEGLRWVRAGLPRPWPA